MSGSVRRFERGEHGDVDRGIPLFLPFLISKSRMCLLSDLSFVFFSRETFHHRRAVEMMTRGRRESDPDKDDERERKKSFNSLLPFCKDDAVCEEERTPKLDF